MFDSGLRFRWPSAAVLAAMHLALTACGGGASGDSPSSGATAAAPASPVAAPDDARKLAKIYDPSYATPVDFYVDERAATPSSYTLHHIKDPSNSFELCTDDGHVAEQWEAADHASRAVNGVYVGSIETRRYFEFVRELAYDNDLGNVGSPSSPGYARVFKCSAINRDGVDRHLLDGFAGRLNMRPLTAESVREFTEYLWQFAYFPGADVKVLDTRSEAAGERLSHTLELALRVNQGQDRCDRIELAVWRFAVDPVSGEVSKSYATIDSFEAELTAAGPSRCD